MGWLPKTCGILVQQPGIRLVSPALEGRFSTTGPLGKSPGFTFLELRSRSDDFSNATFCHPNWHRAFFTRVFCHHPQFCMSNLNRPLSPLPTWNNLLPTSLTCRWRLHLPSSFWYLLISPVLSGSQSWNNVPCRPTDHAPILLSASVPRSRGGLSFSRFLLLLSLLNPGMPFSPPLGPTSELKSSVSLSWAYLFRIPLPCVIWHLAISREKVKWKSSHSVVSDS